MLACLAAGLWVSSMAEEMAGERLTVSADFPGDWYLFEEFQFGLRLPLGWRSVPGKDEVYFMAVDESGDRALWLELYQTEGHSLNDVLSDLSKTPQFQSARGMYFNGVPFVSYTANGLLGYATMTADESILLFIKLMPLEDAELAMWIMATVSPLAALSTEDGATKERE